MLGVAPAGDDLGGDHFDGAGLNTVGCARNLAERNDSTRLDAKPCFPASKHMPTKIMRLKKASTFAHQAYAILMFLY